MHLFKLTDEQLAQILIPKRFVPPTPPEHEGKNMVYVFDSEDKFELTYDELVEITPDDIRLRKKLLHELERRRSGRVYEKTE